METYLVADKSCHVLGHTAHVPNFVVLDHGACESDMQKRTLQEVLVQPRLATSENTRNSALSSADLAPCN